MRDEMDARIWNEHHADFSAFLGRAIDNLWAGFERLVAIEYDAPWRHTNSGNR